MLEPGACTISVAICAGNVSAGTAGAVGAGVHVIGVVDGVVATEKTNFAATVVEAGARTGAIASPTVVQPRLKFKQQNFFLSKLQVCCQ